MRPLRLDLHGFTVFREPTTIDLTDVDFFALVGPTGSGKSTVLDAICFAVYGTVPRWGDRRRIDNALAPSSSEARVRLVFEAAGTRYVATRVVRRDAKGRVFTSHAGLEQLPAGIDLAIFDAAPAERGDMGLGTVLAGSPAEMDAAVLAAVGLPYEQFTTCIVLPQGEFARFLHAKPAERQEILVNLLGLHIYQRIGERAGILAKTAEAKASAARSLLGDLSGADDGALSEAEQAVTRAQRLVTDVELRLPRLIEASAAGEAARAALDRVETDIQVLAAVRIPAATGDLADELIAANDALDAARASVLAAEEKEDKLRAELDTAGDKAYLHRMIDTYAERASLRSRMDRLHEQVRAAGAAHERAAAELTKASARAAKANTAAAQAQQRFEQAQAADRAATLREHLVAGEACPVCEQPVRAVPAAAAPALAGARAKLTTAQQAVTAAVAVVDEHDRTVRESDRVLATATARHGESARRLVDVDAKLADAPELSTMQDELTALVATERELVGASDAVRVARQQERSAANRVRQADDRLRGAWAEFDRVRDGLARLAPPAAARDNLVHAWLALRDWAEQSRTQRATERDRWVEAAQAALAAIDVQVAGLGALFADMGVAAPTRSGEPANYRQAAVLAHERAMVAHQRVLDAREQAQRLIDQVASHEREAQVARSLAQHLRADRFERWLLAEALDYLVHGASRILRELSAGQYDLAHDNGEFFVIDHADAGLRRGVRTLSGGETFQASLALALALSEQLAGLSSAASLESIMLDEGFGALDSSTLDTVAATLENLAAQGDRMVGVVTHVSALAERIPIRFHVSRDARGVARIERTD